MATGAKHKTPPERRKAHEVIADAIRQKIVNGELAQGQRLPPEDELTVQFNVARTTLREALRVLESQGLIAIVRGRGGGPAVTHPSLEPIASALAINLQLRGTTIGDLDAARQMIEPQIAGQLAARHDAADIAALQTVVDEAQAAAEGNDVVAFGLAATLMHETLVERSGNVTMATLTQLLHEMLIAYYLRNPDTLDQALMQRAVRGYRKLITLIGAGDVDGAVAHWQATMRYTISHQNATELVTRHD